MYNTYEDWEKEYIVGFRNIIELMINKGYGWANTDDTIWLRIWPNIRYVSVLITYSDSATLQWFVQTVSFGYDTWPNNWYLYPLEEVKRDYFWQWLEAKWYLIRPRKNINEHVFSVTDKTIWEVSRYVRENVLVRNVKLFQ